MKTKTITLYSFDELSKEAQEKAHSNWIANNDYPFLSDYMNEYLHEALEENKIKDLNDTSKPNTRPTLVMYSLSNSQGDGVMFEGSFEWNEYNVSKKHSGHYYHSNSKDITITDEEGNEVTDNEPNEAFEKIYQSICQELENRGYNFIDYENSLESFKETCEANEYTFELSGKMNNL